MEGRVAVVLGRISPEIHQALEVADYYYKRECLEEPGHIPLSWVDRQQVELD